MAPICNLTTRQHDCLCNLRHVYMAAEANFRVRNTISCCEYIINKNAKIIIKMTYLFVCFKSPDLKLTLFIIQKRNLEVLKLLVGNPKNRGDLNAVMRNGRTPLHIAAESNR